jgi:glycerol-3-phosphate cytidylyltransferase
LPRVVFTAGVFDLLHRGHLNILWRSRQLAGPDGLLVVGVVSDEGAKAYKGRYPVMNEHGRIEAVLRLPFVHAVCRQPTTDPTPLLVRFRPDIMTHGDDWDRLKAGQESIERLGIEWVLLPYTPDISTTNLRITENHSA